MFDIMLNMILMVYFCVSMAIGAIVVWQYSQWKLNLTLKDECNRMEAELCEFEEMLHNFSDFNK